MDKMRISEKITRKLLPITPFLFFQFMIKGITRKKKLLNPCTQRFTVFFIVRQISFISCPILIKIAKIGWEMTYATNLCNLIEDSKKFTIFRTKTVKHPVLQFCFFLTDPSCNPFFDRIMKKDAKKIRKKDVGFFFMAAQMPPPL